MDTKQNTLDGFVKSQKRPTNDDNVYKISKINNTNRTGIVKSSRKLSFDSSSQQTIKKQKVESDNTQTIFHGNNNLTYSTNTVNDSTLETNETEHKNEVEPERAKTPDQSPSTKAKLRKELDLGEFRKIVRCKRNFKKLQEKISSVEQYQNDLKCIESKVEAAKSHYLSSFKSIDFMVDTNPILPEMSPIQKPKLKPTILFPNSAQSIISPKKLMTETQTTLSKVYVSPGKLLDEIESILSMSPSKRYSSLANSNPLPLPLKYRNLDELFKAMETVLSMIFKRRERITFNRLKRGVQKLIRKNFTELHLAQIKTIVPDFFEYSLMKSSDKPSFELEIAPIYGLENDDNIDLTELTTWRKKKFYSSLLGIMKKYHQDYLNELTPPIVIDEDKITRWHPEFDVESVPDIIPSSLPKIEIDKPKIESVKDISDRSHALFVYNNLLNRNFTMNHEQNKNVNVKNFPTEDAKSALKGSLKDIPNLFLSKIQIETKQEENTKELMTRSLGQLDEDIMTNRLPDIARRINTYFSRLKRNVMPLKKVIDQLKQSYPEAMADQDWKSHFNLLEEKVPHWIEIKELDGLEHIRIEKKVKFEESVVIKLKI